MTLVLFPFVSTTHFLGDLIWSLDFKDYLSADDFQIYVLIYQAQMSLWNSRFIYPSVYLISPLEGLVSISVLEMQKKSSWFASFANSFLPLSVNDTTLYSTAQSKTKRFSFSPCFLPAPHNPHIQSISKSCCLYLYNILKVDSPHHLYGHHDF